MNPRKPRSLKVLSGTDQPCRRAAAERAQVGAVLAEFPPPPQWLDVDGAEMWNHHGAALHAAGRLRDIHLPMLEVVCMSWSQFRKDARAGRTLLPVERARLVAELREIGMTAGPGRALVEGSTPSNQAAPANRFAKFVGGKRA
jgi:phage terminase small subunit